MSDQDNNTPNTKGSLPFFDFFKSYGNFPEGFNDLYSVHLKNVQTINMAQQASLENFQEIAHKQNQIFNQIMQHTTTMANDLISESKPEEKMKKNAENFQKGYEQAMQNAKEISDLLKKSGNDTGKILTKRVTETYRDIKNISEKQA